MINVHYMQVPFTETDRVDSPASLYAATKRSCELLAGVYHNIYNVSTTGLRFFTVYGPWGRPDMAALAFAHKITAGHPVKIFQGADGQELARDFTYIDDIVQVCSFVTIVSSVICCVRVSILVNAWDSPVTRLTNAYSTTEHH